MRLSGGNPLCRQAILKDIVNPTEVGRKSLIPLERVFLGFHAALTD